MTMCFTDCLSGEQEYQLADAEAHTLLPCLIEKSGHNQASNLARMFRYILLFCGSV